MSTLPVPDFRTREQLVYEYLRSGIVSGALPPNEPLVGSRVAVELGVSRITIAHALKRLTAEGFVHSTPHKEAVVTALRAPDIEEVYTMRAALEGEAAFVACLRAAPHDVAHLRRLNSAVGLDEGSGDAAATTREADQAFHAYVGKLADMPRLTKAINDLADRCEYYRARLLEQAGARIPLRAWHEELIDAMDSGDAPRARECAREHVRRGMRLILDALERNGGGNQAP